MHAPAEEYRQSTPPETARADRPLYCDADESMQAELAKFLEHLSLTTVSADSRRSRKSHLSQFVRWCEARDVVSPRKITADVVREFLLERRREGAAPATLAVKASAMRAFMRWLVDRGYMPRAPHVDKPRVKFGLPQVLKLEHIEAMLRACDDGLPNGARDRALIETLYATGMRIGEAWQLNIEDLDLAAGTAKVHGKGDEWRVVLLTRPAVDALRVYISRFRFAGKAPFDQRAVFVSQRGHRCARNVLYTTIRRRAQLAGLDDVKVHPHLFRHSMATHLLEKGADIRTVQALLGHTSIQSTVRYTQLSKERLRAELQRCHPRESAPVAAPSVVAPRDPANGSLRGEIECHGGRETAERAADVRQ